MSSHHYKTPFVNVDQAVKILSGGGLVALPTETVYGLAAIANQPDAISKIFKAKGRPSDHPLIVHVSTFDEIYQWAKDVPEKAQILGEKFWPGPLTMVFNKSDMVNSIVTGGQDTIALRIPNQKITLEILKKLGTGVAAPSANRFGRVSPTLPRHVFEELDGLIDGVVDGGQCQVGIESTIIDMTTEMVRILRPGQISLNDLELCLGEQVSINTKNSPRVPGLLKSHYAPQTPLRLIESKKLNMEIEKLLSKGIQFNLWSFEKPEKEDELIKWVQAINEPNQFAHELYDQLRQFDSNDSKITLIEFQPTVEESWRGVIDRLTRAQAHFEIN